MNKRRQTEIESYLFNWSSFHPKVATLNMEEVDHLIEYEKRNSNRTTFIGRLKRRRRKLLVEKVREENSDS